MINADVCNMALGYIGKAPIVTIDDNTDNARKCKLYYDNCRRQILRSFEWNFARKKEKLALLADTCCTDYKHVYAYPEDALLIYSVGEDAAYKIVGYNKNVKGIATDTANAEIDYLWDVEDLSIWPPDLVSALAHLLASNIAIALAGNSSTMKEQLDLYHVDLQNAKTNAAYEQRTKMHLGGFTYLRSRK